ncbi:MAG TPA: efflux RND transporter periplasmic adaptor subunit [Gammaproteobacteria bacterium]|nr:efflux RND transporter periplasmic adaptor subunit [Gammaproteobacteria bacterium]
MKQFICLALALVFVAACDNQQAGNDDPRKTENQSAADTQSSREILFYRHPMNPEITSPVPREDSMGMPYTPVYASEAKGVVEIGPAIVQSLGVATAQVQQNDLPRIIETAGYVSWNEALLHHIHPRAPGWVKEVTVYSVGEQVEAGQKLFTYYAPEIVTAQRDYLRALANNTKPLIDASRERLLALGMAPRDIETITQTRDVMQAIGFYAPFAGVISQLNVRHGMYITPATEAIALARLDSVWVRAEVFPAQMHSLALGQMAMVSTTSLPGEIFHGTLDYLAPAVDTLTRTRSARLTLENPGHLLLPGMYAEVRIHGRSIENAVHIPLSALIRTGEQARVVLALDEGRFISREVTPGIVTNGRAVIIQGLSPGERVVTSAQFLLDSEASLRQVDNRMDSVPSKNTADKSENHKQHDMMQEMDNAQEPEL